MAKNQVMEYAAKLEERLKNEGPLTVEDVKLWLNDAQVPPEKLGPIMGQGAKLGAHKWYREGETLYAGRRPGTVDPPPRPRTPRGADAIPTVAEAMDRPTGQSKFQGLLESIGVDESQAKQAANFCYNAFDMENPSEVWQALRECPQVGQPVVKKQAWRLWTRTLRVDIPETLLQEISSWGRALVPSPAQVGRKYCAIDGQVVPTTLDDPEAMSMADALRLASLQKGDKPRDDQASGGMVTTLLQQQGETDRERLKLEATKNGRHEGESVMAALITQQGEMVKTMLTKPPDTSFEGRIEAQRHEFEARMDAQNQRFMDLMAGQGERHQHMLEMVQTNNNHSLELIRIAMEGNKNQPSFFEQLEQAISNKVIADFLKPQPSPVPWISGPDGKGGMTLEVYKAIREMDMKAETLAFGKQTVPELIKTVVDMTQATRELAASRGHTIDDGDQPADDPVLLQTTCGHCSQSMTYPAGAAFLVCPHCRAPQTSDGRLMIPQGPGAHLDELKEPEIAGIQEIPDLESRSYRPQEQAPVGEDSSPILFGTYFLEPSLEPTRQEPGKPQELEQLSVPAGVE